MPDISGQEQFVRRHHTRTDTDTPLIGCPVVRCPQLAAGLSRLPILEVRGVTRGVNNAAQRFPFPCQTPPWRPNTRLKIRADSPDWLEIGSELAMFGMQHRRNMILFMY